MRQWTLEDLTTEIHSLTFPAVTRMRNYLGGSTSVTILTDARRTARICAEAMMGPKDSSLLARNALAVAFGDAPPADFWGTQVGQAFYAAGGFSCGFVRKVEAASILGVSHQSVTYSIKSGELVASGNLIQASSVRAKWLKRGGDKHPLALERKSV